MIQYRYECGWKILGDLSPATYGVTLSAPLPTGVNFLNENTLRCHYGTKVGAPACTSGATGTFLPCTTPGCCKAATLNPQP